MAILENIQIKIDFEAVRRRLRLTRDSELKAVRNLVDTAQPLLETKVLYKVCYIEEKYDDGVKVEGLLLNSEVLRKNLEKTERIFPFVVTIGNKFGERLDSSTDLFEKFCLDTIGNVACTSPSSSNKGFCCSMGQFGKEPGAMNAVFSIAYVDFR